MGLNAENLGPRIEVGNGLKKPETGDGLKKDDGKLRMDLVPPLPLEKLAEVYTIGANKYSDNGWLKNPIPQNRVLAAMKRHLAAWEKGEDRDPVDGQLHMAAIAWGCFTIMHYREYGLTPDERPFSEQARLLVT